MRRRAARAEVARALLCPCYRGVAVGRIGETERAKPTYETSIVARRCLTWRISGSQAKLVLRWHRDRYYPVAAQGVRSVLPRFRQLSDPEILNAPFKLAGMPRNSSPGNRDSKAQAGAQTGTASHVRRFHAHHHASRITAVAAELFVSDIQVSCDFLPGSSASPSSISYGEPPFYGQVNAMPRGSISSTWIGP